MKMISLYNFYQKRFDKLWNLREQKTSKENHDSDNIKIDCLYTFKKYLKLK